MTILYEIVTLFLIYLCGVALSSVIPVPGSLLSMAIFFVLLLFRVFKQERYTALSGIILRNLSFFFLPPAVKIIDSMGILRGNIGKIVLILIISNILVMIVSGTVVQFFLNRGNRDD